MSLPAPREHKHSDRTSALRSFGDVLEALDRLPLPVFAVRKDGVIRWLNMAAERAVGPKVGMQFTRVVAPESRATVSDAFASKILGTRAATDYKAVLAREDGTHVAVEVCSVPIDGDAGIVGVFGVAASTGGRPPSDPPSYLATRLTPRQAEVLRHLTRGSTTDEMAAAMGISTETVRNHIRGLLRALHVHSRLEAVAAAQMRGLI